jgi:hypothetical protein
MACLIVYSTSEWNKFIYKIMHSWFSNKIFNLFAISYRHEIYFLWQLNYSNKTFAQGNLVNYHKIIVCCNKALCNETIYVAITHTAMKQFTRQLSLLPRNNLHGNWAKYYKTLFIGIGLVARKVYLWQQHSLP